MPKILIVEDNEENRDSLSRRLQRRGYEVVAASDGKAGVAMAQSEKPDLILMDMTLPEVERLGSHAADQGNRRVATTCRCVPLSRRSALAGDIGDAFRRRPVVRRLSHEARRFHEAAGTDGGHPAKATGELVGTRGFVALRCRFGRQPR